MTKLPSLLQGVALELDPMWCVNKPIEDRIGDGFFPYDFKPTGNGQLTGDDRCRASVPVFDDLHQIHAVANLYGDKTEVVDDQEISASNAVKDLGGRTLNTCDLTSHEEFFHVVVGHAMPERNRCNLRRRPSSSFRYDAQLACSHTTSDRAQG